jgi:integrase
MNTNSVNLYNNSGYWKIKYYDSLGRRKTKSLGSIKNMGARQARVLAERFMAEIRTNPAKANMGMALSLSDYLKRYLDSRTDLKTGSMALHQLTVNYLKKYFGEDLRIDRITRATAADWQSSLARGILTNDKIPAKATVCLHTRNAKTIFHRAVRDDLILFNPFDRLKSTAPEPDKNWHYVSHEELQKLLNACPTRSWKLLLSLCRLAGLRQGEALRLPWSAIDWDTRKMEVIAEKTGHRRIVPIESELYHLLLDAFSVAAEKEPWVIPIGSIGETNLWRDFKVICKKAKLDRWADWCQVLRRNCETDWAQKYPQYVVSYWIGHDITVSARHYLQVPEELYEKVAGK